MLDKLKEVPEKLLEFWNKYSAKQKGLSFCVDTDKLYAFGYIAG